LRDDASSIAERLQALKVVIFFNAEGNLINIFFSKISFLFFLIAYLIKKSFLNGTAKNYTKQRQISKVPDFRN
jgi:hypothetical protein